MKTTMKKELPNPKEQNIIPPDMDYMYFDGFESYPLEPEDNGYSPVISWWLAEAAFLAYTHPGFARMACKLAGFDRFRFFQGIGTECMVSWNLNAVIVAFRGTELKSRSVFHEIHTDLNARPVPFESGGKVHKGFLKGLEEIWSGPEGLEQCLKERVQENPERSLLITGHSMGGALAALCFARIPEAGSLYIYGSPRIGDSGFRELFENRPVWRIENARDPVPLVPPDIPLLKFKFEDIGTLKFISREGKVLNERPVFIMDDQKTRYLEAKSILDRRIKEIDRSMSDDNQSGVKSKRVISRINKQLQIAREEWKNHLDTFFRDFGLNVDEHQPIFYAVKLWNALIDNSEGMNHV
jgi:hypothetical protein